MSQQPNSDEIISGLKSEVEQLKNTLAPFASVVEAFNSNSLRNARPSWSDWQGDQDGVVLLTDVHGGALLTLRDFIRASVAVGDFSISEGKLK